LPDQFSVKNNSGSLLGENPSQL